MKLSLLFFTCILLAVSCINHEKTNDIQISLAEWSLHRALESGKIANLDFPRIARQQFNIGAIEYVNAFFMEHAQDTAYLTQLHDSCKRYQVKSLLIMIDDEGDLGDTNKIKRDSAVYRHLKWIDAAAFLQCHSVRVNAVGDGDKAAVQKACVESISTLCDYAAKKNINVIIENHYGHSFDPAWVLAIVKAVNKPNVGTLPDFGNFTGYDLYAGTAMLMPYAKGVSGKALDFDTQGNETTMDYSRLMEIIKRSGFKGYIDIEYEGERFNENEGIQKTKALIEKYL